MRERVPERSHHHGERGGIKLSEQAVAGGMRERLNQRLARCVRETRAGQLRKRHVYETARRL